MHGILLLWNMLDNQITGYPPWFFLLTLAASAFLKTSLKYHQISLLFVCWILSSWMSAAVNEMHSLALEMLEWLTRSKYHPGKPRSPLAGLLCGWACRQAGGWTGGWQNSHPPWLSSELCWTYGCETFQGGWLSTVQPDSFRAALNKLFENCRKTQ